MTIHFDVTDIVYFATRYSRVTGIQRVQLNIITLLARKHGAAAVRCTFFDSELAAIIEFSAETLGTDREFDAEAFLSAIGRGSSSVVFPSKARIKSYLRRFNNRKWLRTIKKADIYVSALLRPSRLIRYGLAPTAAIASGERAITARIERLPDRSTYVCMGSVWLHQSVLDFGRDHAARGGAVIQMVYDMIPIVHPEYYTVKEADAYAAWLNDAFNYVSKFMCISKWTKSDLLAFAARNNYRPIAQAIPLAHEFFGFGRFQKAGASAELSTLLSREYVLCVGTIETRKNCTLLMSVWRELLSEVGDKLPLLVFAGKFGKGSDEFQSLHADVELARNVQVIHSPSDRELVWLYQNCLFTAYPSGYEGWGLPVGEAAWFGKHSVVSRATSIPEVCGELIDYFDPNDRAEIKAKIRRVLDDRHYLAERESAIMRATLRTWADVADDIHRFAMTGTVETNIGAG